MTREHSTEPAADPAAQLDVRLVPAAVTCWMVTAGGIVWPIAAALAGCCLVLVSASGLLWWRARRAQATRLVAMSAGLVAVGVVGTGYGLAIGLRADAVAHHPIAAAFGTAETVTVAPSESALPVGRGRLMFRAHLLRLRDQESSGRVLVFARSSESGGDFDDLTVGQPVRFTARIARPKRHDLTVAVLTATGTPTVGSAGPVQRAAHSVRRRFSAAVHEVLPADEAAMLPALVLGDTSLVAAGTSTEFRAAGMTHLTAVSGANVTIVCAAVLLSARLVGPRAAVALAGIALVAFVIVVQPTPSVLRAAVMGAIALAAMLSSRSRQAIPALATTVLVLLAVAPQLAVDLGFSLSVIATAALVVVAPAWSRQLVRRGCPKPLADAVAVAGAAQAVTAPLVAAISGRFSLIAVLANLVVAPAIAPITVLGTSAAVLAAYWPGVAQLVIRFTGPEVWWVLRVAHWSAGVPGGAVPVPPGAAGLVIVGCSSVLVAVLWRWRWFRSAAVYSALAGAFCLVASVAIASAA